MFNPLQKLVTSLPFLDGLSVRTNTGDLPIVDLGYLRQQATEFNVSPIFSQHLLERWLMF